MMQYISNSFSKASQTYNLATASKTAKTNYEINVDTGKAKNRIPKWALKTEQYNHKIVRALFSSGT